jgi:putative ABC transport system permease protein
MRTMTAQLDTVTALERQIAMLLAVFATLSLGIAALGQYAIATFHVRRRARDFGVRMALGATPERIQRSVIRDALTLTGIGLLMGFGLSVLAGFALMAVTSVVASVVPAWRAGRVNVVEALRQE